MDERRHRSLLEGLVGDEHVRLYQTSPEFKFSIDTLARTLPIFVEALVADAERAADLRYQALVRIARHSTPPAASPYETGGE